jgi:hypothetical protein
MKAFLIAAIALMVACGFQLNKTGEYLVYVDPAFTPDRQGEIRAAIIEWNQATEGTVVLIETAAPNGSHLIKISPTEFSASSRTAGECKPYEETIQIQDNMKTDLTRRTALHEIGHSLGLEHSETGTIMCWQLGCASKHLTCADLTQFCSIWKCDANTLAVCQ